jgi:hypothetical protein
MHHHMGKPTVSSRGHAVNSLRRVRRCKEPVVPAARHSGAFANQTLFEVGCLVPVVRFGPSVGFLSSFKTQPWQRTTAAYRNGRPPAQTHQNSRTMISATRPPTDKPLPQPHRKPSQRPSTRMISANHVGTPTMLTNHAHQPRPR